MQNEVIAKIDALVRMSDSSTNINTIKVELRELECAIKEKKLELNELKSSITDDKYFDASGEVVDKNIEISLSKKIKSLKKSLADIEEQLRKNSLEEAKSFNEVKNIKKDLDEAESFVEVLDAKISSSNNDNFRTLHEETKKKINELRKELNKKEKNYEKIQGKLEVLSFSKEELKNKIESETEKLIDIKANLLNKRGYVNTELKQEDQNAISKLEKEIAELVKEKARLASDPIMIADEAKTNLIDDDKTSALKKIKELRDIVLTQPYMDVASNNGDILTIELETAEAKRDEYASMINSKNYESVDTTLIKDRIAYITDIKEQLLKEIQSIKEKIKSIDSIQLEDLNNRINYCENEVEGLKDKMDEYAKTLENEDLTVVKKASLQASFDKKQEEINNILELLASYKNDRRALITDSYKLEQENIKAIENKIELIEKEIKKLEKLSVATTKSKDTIAMENDKKTLKELNDNIKAIKKRQSLKNNPSEIYDEIEMLLGTESTMVNETEEFEIESPQLDDSLFEMENVAIEENINEIPQLERNDEEESIEENSNDILNIEPEEVVLDTIEQIPEAHEEEIEMTDINNEEEKIKVINIEPLDNDVNSSNEEIDTENSKENAFLIGDYEG